MPQKEIIESFGSALNFFANFNELKKALNFYSLLEESEWQTFYSLIFKTPFFDRLALFNRYRSSFNISDEDIVHNISLLDSDSVQKRKIEALNRGQNSLLNIEKIFANDIMK